MDVREDIQLDLPGSGLVQNAGAEDSLEILFRAQHSRLLNLLTRITGDRGRAEELASEAFWKLANRPKLFRPGNNLEGWLYRVAMNLGLNYLRMNARRRRYEQAAAEEGVRSTAKVGSPLDEMLRSEQRQRVRMVLSKMKPAGARVLVFRNTGFSYRELSQVLEMNPASVGKFLLRSMEEFERKYKEMFEVKT